MRSNGCDPPFEELGAHGADAHYVGHPSLNGPWSREAQGDAMTPPSTSRSCGSRSSAERYLLMLRGARLRAERGAIDARAVVAPAPARAPRPSLLSAPSAPASA
jgi:hypothetical protein